MNTIVATRSSADFVRSVTDAEQFIIESLQVPDKLYAAVSTGDGLRRFAGGFYFVRINFVKLNFIVGSRCPVHELYWSGLARNLIEELGGERGPTHNELYRWFLVEAGITSEEKLVCPPFAAEFEHNWESYCRTAALDKALGAIAVYEMFDEPDYKMLLDVMKKARIGKRGLAFYRVHAKAAHFELFESFFSQACSTSNGRSALQSATGFVIESQKRMWSGLLDYVKKT